MEESQNEILQLLREPRRSALAPLGEIPLPREPMPAEDVLSEHPHVEIPPPPPRRCPRAHQDNELADTASSTHPSQADRQPLIPPGAPEDLDRSHIAELPRNALRHELRRLVREEFPREQGRPPIHRWDFQETSATLDFRQPQDFCLVARLSPVVGLLPVVGLSSDIYLTLNFLWLPDFCLSPDFCDAGLSPVTGFLPHRQTFARRRTFARRPTFVGHLPDTELPPVVGLLPVAGLLRRWTFASHRISASSPDFRPSKLIVKLSGSELRTQRHQNRLNPSPNESRSRTRSTVGRFKTQFGRIERLDETSPTSPRSQNPTSLSQKIVHRTIRDQGVQYRPSVHNRPFFHEFMGHATPEKL
ncbi:hypothetical protein M5K25_012712 [Dendrobium thyrsiflorum]|uniref:Uncharacterized protein n=1 Tax=Dendrobium thyrsiflorum TaxID=117978 RepID=A0ABD0V527_DENTH